MLARAIDGATAADFPGAAFEPKWDGFRCLAFIGSDAVVLQGRGRSSGPEAVVDLSYAFPELVEALGRQVRPGTVLDGEIVAIVDGRLDFAALSGRLRPRAASSARSIADLATRLPASFLAFDLLSVPDAMPDAMPDAQAGRPDAAVLLAAPFAERRVALEGLSASWEPPLLLTPCTRDATVAMAWFDRFEAAGVDGLIVKPLEGTYQPGRRSQVKIKHRRTADVVVAGWRPQQASDGTQVVGSLLLGLHDDQGRLHYVGGTSAFTAERRRALAAELAGHALGPDARHPWTHPDGNRVPGQASRWGPGKAWRALDPVQVAEVEFDQVQDGRLRHTAGFIRWRPDRSPDSCGFDQFPVMPGVPIDELLDWAGPAAVPPASLGSRGDTAAPAGPRQHRDPRA